MLADSAVTKYSTVCCCKLSSLVVSTQKIAGACRPGAWEGRVIIFDLHPLMKNGSCAPVAGPSDIWDEMLCTRAPGSTVTACRWVRMLAVMNFSNHCYTNQFKCSIIMSQTDSSKPDKPQPEFLRPPISCQRAAPLRGARGRFHGVTHGSFRRKTSGNCVPIVKVFMNALQTALRTIFRPKMQ